MNFQEFAEKFHAPTGIFSVEKKDDGGYGDIRIVTGNKIYLDILVHTVVPGVTKEHENEFVPNSLYEKYLPRDVGFYDLFYRAAVRKIPIHTNFRVDEMNMWFDVFIMPLEPDDGNICYCSYTARPVDPNEAGISSAESGRATEDILKTCIKLHGSDDFRETLADAIKDIRILCHAEVCTIMLLDDNSETYSIFAKSVDPNCTLKTVTQFVNFNDIAASWVEMIGDSDCYLIKNREDMEHTKKINNMWYLTLEEAEVKSVILCPLRYNGELFGFIWATNFNTENTTKTKDTFELTTFFIASQLASYKMVERLKQISYTDLLTGLPNRFACSEYIEALIKLGGRFAVASTNINGFKSINNTMGFDAGNKVLKKIAERWTRISEQGLSDTQDYIARLSGDEFALVIRGYDSDMELLKTIKQYEAALGKRITVDDCDFYITSSFGYAEFPADADSKDMLYSCADSAMHEVKRINSSNHIMRYIQGMLKSEQTLDIENKIRAALENDLLYFNLQPQYDMSHKLRGFESLARMRDEDGNFISPGQFIPVAEKVGLIDKVDGTVFRKSAMFLGSLLKDTDADITLSVNASVRHMMKNDFIDEVREILAASGLSPSQLEIEITESIMIDSAEKAQQRIDVLKGMGIKIAIDDFGTGYSSLSYLNKFPADLLKIDKSFIDKMNTGESSKQYVAAIISIGHIMNFDVIAEGVEEPAQLETLKEIGCDFIQGYIWGRPLPKEEAEKIVIEALEELKK